MTSSSLSVNVSQAGGDAKIGYQAELAVNTVGRTRLGSPIYLRGCASQLPDVSLGSTTEAMEGRSNASAGSAGAPPATTACSHTSQPTCKSSSGLKSTGHGRRPIE